jgi:putative salt-induced outer membrane protein YdiY
MNLSKHPRRHLIACLAAGAAIFCAGTEGAAQAAPPKPQELSADLGFVTTSGNARITTLNIGEKLIVRRGRFEHRQQFGSVYAQEDGEQTSNLLFANVRSDFALNKHLAVFAYVGFDRNQFAGIARRFEEALGLSLKLLDNERDQWRVEAGLAMTQQRSTLDSVRNFASLRSGTTYKHFFSKAAYFLQTVEYLPSLEVGEDYRITSETALVAPISAHIGMKLGYTVRFDNLPEPNTVKSDRIFTAGLQFNW